MIKMDSIRFDTKFVTRQPAVTIVNAYKTYSGILGSNPIIKNLTMNVEKGKIYSLLGSSGCGKTTLLSCVTGMKVLDSGEVLVFGKKPGTKECGIPGRRIGFMPQEIALHGEFTIREVLRYFGKIYGMRTSDVDENTEFLMNFLKLPPPERRINSLSGGQQRRVSFAVALIHNPELLILDEPTVGVDPLLRQSIWSHLVKLAATSNTTIIITTHFIEEARDSHRIGLMRNGRLLTEDTPENLMEMYNTSNLEEIVVELCLKDTPEEKDESTGQNEEVERIPSSLPRRRQITKMMLSASSLNTANGTLDLEPLEVPYAARWPSLGQLLHRATIKEPSETKKSQEIVEKFHRINALLYKNVLVLLRNYIFLGFLIGQPAFQIVMTCLAIGADPHDVYFGYINNEVGLNRECSAPANEVGCMISSPAKYKSFASCEFIRVVRTDVFELVKYETVDEAIMDAKLGKIYGFMVFPQNFTIMLKERLSYGTFSSLEVLLNSRIELRLDMSSKQIALLIQKFMLEAFQEFMIKTAKLCKIDVEGLDLPVYFGEPIFGRNDTSFTEYVAPGAIIALLFFFSICSAAMAMISEKCSGALERTMVAGVTNVEIMLSHCLTQFVLLVIQATLAYVIVFIFFKIEVVGSFPLAFSIGVLIGVAGMSFGFLVAAVCRNELESVLMTIAAFMPNLILSGVIWPLEGMPKYLLYCAYCLPCTFTGASLRAIISRGSNLLHPNVWPGFVSTVFWICLYWISAISLNKIKTKH